MAIQGPIPISFEQVFPHGCYLVGNVEQVKDFDASTNGRTVYAKDRTTGEPVWQVPVMDGDPTVKASQKTVAVKILSATEPIAPPAVAGVPITPVEFVGMTVTPYVSQTGRLAYSLRATGMRPPRAKQAPAGKEAAA
ncbi:plasmid replication, integration and excision activator [Nonomuraea sp. 3-1Str]|uniref:plasmid replication, integration and excision activator n=1 Tax=Nonomuraea sp. 3-1Str TaxID=2929801 RepID=UPI00286104CE|nr:plasmid replication, integration and excision activator [Nonomuraea sp. 3-1Str]MDR8407810.1 plasmid replication, integration and excision activator [Nonomuraea sp. 3-1Str]